MQKVQFAWDCKKLLKYAREIILFNKVHNLVATSDLATILDKHIKDSLLGAPLIKAILETQAIGGGAPIGASLNTPTDTLIKVPICTSTTTPTGAPINTLSNTSINASIADVGSGAGLPGIPLAVVFPDISFTLIEKQAKRVNFLQNEIAILPLKNVKVLQADFSKTKETFDIVTFRAFSPLTAELISQLQSLTKPGGKILAYKGKTQKAREELNAAKIPPARQKLITLSPERALVIIDK